MKLLLTSAGITNKSIADVLFSLVGKKAEDTSLVFIPTASNIETGDKAWLIDDLINLKNQHFKSIAIADISVVEEKVWRPQFEEADVLFFEGGNMYHLMEWINKSGLANLLPDLLQSRVYVGSSAGSMVTNKDLLLPISQIVYEEDLDKKENMKGLDYVDFYFLPHLNSEYFPKVRKKNIEATVKGMSEKVYALDDDSALKVIDGTVEIVGGGEYIEFH